MKKDIKKTVTTKTTIETIETTTTEDLLDNLDIVFVIDATGSMGIYIDSAKEYAAKILKDIADRGNINIRAALVAYRDHPPQDSTFVTKVFDFDELNKFHGNLQQLGAGGGGDWPEAVYDGINELFNLKWRPKSDRLVYLIGDAPPHAQCPCGLTPEKLIKKLNKFNIEFNAHSIANNQITTKEFDRFVKATNGKITVGNGVQDSINLYSSVTTTHSDYINLSKSFVAGASYTNSGEMSMASIVANGETVGLSAEESLNAYSYLNKRGLRDNA